jgi:hypothetical protein
MWIDFMLYALARIAGHASIIVTQRYIHPPAEAIEQAFARLTGSQKVVIDGGQSQLAPTTR